jgi:hypothetical protein
MWAQPTGDVFSGRTVANCLYGLQNMSAASPEVRQLLGLLALHLDHQATDFTGQHLSMSFYGLQHMQVSSSRELEEFLWALLWCVRETNHPMNTLNTAMSVFGLKSMSARDAVVRQLIDEFASKLSCADDDFEEGFFELGEARSDGVWESGKGGYVGLSGSEVALTLQGLGNMGSEWPQVQHILSELANQMPTLAFARAADSFTYDRWVWPMRARELAISLNALRSMGGGKDTSLHSDDHGAGGGAGGGGVRSSSRTDSDSEFYSDGDDDDSKGDSDGDDDDDDDDDSDNDGVSVSVSGSDSFRDSVSVKNSVKNSVRDSAQENSTSTSASGSASASTSSSSGSGSRGRDGSAFFTPWSPFSDKFSAPGLG